MDDYKIVLELEPDNSDARDGLRRTIAKINESSSSKADPDRAAHAMADPEIQAILRDPMVSRLVVADSVGLPHLCVVLCPRRCRLRLRTCSVTLPVPARS